MLSNDIMDYHIVSQGKTTIPSVDDGEEMQLTDVRAPQNAAMLSIESCLQNYHKIKIALCHCHVSSTLIFILNFLELFRIDRFCCIMQES